MLVQNRVKNYRRTTTAKRRPPRGHFVQDCPKGEQVRSRIEFISPGLFGRHVGYGAHGHAGAGQVLIAQATSQRVGIANRCLRTSGAVGFLGQPEIKNLRLAPGSYENVRRLDVTMENTFRMCGIECVGNLNRQLTKRLELGPFPKPTLLRAFPQAENRSSIPCILSFTYVKK